MKKSINNLFTIFIVSILVFVISGCSFALDRTLKKTVSDEELITSVSKIVDEQLEIVAPYFEETDKSLDLDQMTGEQVVSNSLKEDGGKDYLRFNYSIALEGEESLEDIAYQAKALLPEEETYKIDEKLTQTRNFINKDIAVLSKSVPPSQQIAALDLFGKLFVG